LIERVALIAVNRCNIAGNQPFDLETGARVELKGIKESTFYSVHRYILSVHEVTEFSQFT
jgi:hypothetical protein